MRFQVANPNNVKIKRTDHVWSFRKSHWLCVLCGGVTANPPSFPTPKVWEPDQYVKLTQEDRSLCPFVPKAILEVE